MTRVIHSLWGEPCANSPYKHNAAWYYALSLLYVKSNPNTVVVLYADKIGLEILSKVLFLYDEVHEIEIPSNISPRFFACIKYLALSREPLDSIHIDGDVFFKTKESWQLLLANNKDCDVFTQGAEPIDPKYNVYHCFEQLGFRFDCDISIYKPLNTGILCFHNEALKQHYITNYFKCVETLSDIWCFEDGLIPDLIIEQSYLGNYCMTNGYRIGELISEDNWLDVNAAANKVGYAHIWGKVKNEDYMLMRVKNRLQEEFPSIYNIIKRKV